MLLYSRLIESGLKYRYHAAWCQVLGTIQVAFEVDSREAQEMDCVMLCDIGLFH